MLFRFLRRLLGGGEESTPATLRNLDFDTRTESPYRAIGISPGEPSCTGARQIASLRFLYRSAPPLPLPECDSPECHCTYSHYSDRRSGADRRSITVERPPGMVERRSGYERRRFRRA
jgi:hypothetical protein